MADGISLICVGVIVGDEVLYVCPSDGGRESLADGKLLFCADGVADGLRDGVADGISLIWADGGPVRRRGSIALAIRSPLIRNEVAS